MKYTVDVHMRRMKGVDENGLTLDRTFQWTLYSDESLRKFFVSCKSGELGLISFTVTDTEGTISRFNLKPTGEFIYSGGYPSPTYDVVLG